MGKSYLVTMPYLVVEWDVLTRIDVAVGIAGGDFHGEWGRWGNARAGLAWPGARWLSAFGFVAGVVEQAVPEAFGEAGFHLAADQIGRASCRARV